MTSSSYSPLPLTTHSPCRRSHHRHHRPDRPRWLRDHSTRHRGVFGYVEYPLFLFIYLFFFYIIIKYKLKTSSTPPVGTAAVNVVVALGHERLYSDMVRILKDNANVSVLKLAKSGGVRRASFLWIAHRGIFLFMSSCTLFPVQRSWSEMRCSAGSYR